MANAKIEIQLPGGATAGKTLQELTKEANKLYKEISKLPVGSDEFVKKSADLQQVSGRIKEVKTQVNGTTEASNALKDAFSRFVPFSGTFMKLGSTISGARGSVGGLTNSFGLLKGAIIATGIGALVALIGSLVAWFKKTDEGATKLDGIFRAIGNTVDVLLNRLINLGDTLKQLFTNPGKFFRGLVADIKEGIKLGDELANTFDMLDQKRRDMELGTAESQKIIDQLLLQSKNVSLSYKERLELLDQAGKKEQENFLNELDYHKQRLAAIQRETDFMIKQGTISDDQLDKLNEARIAVINLERESINVQEKIENRRSQLLEKQKADQEKAAAAENKRQEKLQKDREDQLKKELSARKNTEDLKLELIDNAQVKEIQKLKLDTQRKIEALVGSEEQIREQKALLKVIELERIAEIEEKYRKASEAKTEEDRKQEFEKRLKAQELELATELNLLNEQILSRQINEQQYIALTEQLALDHQSRKLDIIRAQHGEESAEYQRAYGEFLDLQNAANERMAADQQAALEGSLGTFGNFFGAIAGMQKQGTEQWKAFATAQAVLSTIQGAINAYQSTAAIPIVGPGLAPIAAGIALAAGYARVREIQKTKVESPVGTTQKKEKGGYLQGPRHSQGGIHIEAEGGEFIFSRKAVQAIGVGELNRINSFYTNRFADGGPVNPLSNTSSMSPSGSGAGSSSLFSGMDLLASKINDLIAAQDRRIDRIKVQNVVTETEDALKTVNTIRDEADV